MALITPKEAYARKSRGWNHIDVRTPNEFALLRTPNSVNIPIMVRGPKGMKSNLDFLATVAAKFSIDDKIIVSCTNGSRSTKAVVKLYGAGYKNLADMQGGITAWAKQESLPLK